MKKITIEEIIAIALRDMLDGEEEFINEDLHRENIDE